MIFLASAWRAKEYYFDKEEEIVAEMNKFKSLHPEMQSPVVAHTLGPSRAFGDIKEEQSVTVDYPDDCVEIKDPTEGDAGQVKDDQGKAVDCKVALESELSCDETGEMVNVEIPRYGEHVRGQAIS